MSSLRADLSTLTPLMRKEIVVGNIASLYQPLYGAVMLLWLTTPVLLVITLVLYKADVKKYTVVSFVGLVASVAIACDLTNATFNNARFNQIRSQYALQEPSDLMARLTREHTEFGTTALACLIVFALFILTKQAIYAEKPSLIVAGAVSVWAFIVVVFTMLVDWLYLGEPGKQTATQAEIWNIAIGTEKVVWAIFGVLMILFVLYCMTIIARPLAKRVRTAIKNRRDITTKTTVD